METQNQWIVQEPAFITSAASPTRGVEILSCRSFDAFEVIVPYYGPHSNSSNPCNTSPLL
jgi:hypothetical protein